MIFFSSHRLALYVYEYLLHIGAQKSAQTFLSEVCGKCSTILKCPFLYLNTAFYVNVLNVLEYGRTIFLKNVFNQRPWIIIKIPIS